MNLTTNTKGLQRWLVLPDLQIPYEDNKTLAVIEKYMADVAKSDHPFDGWLQIGDFLDFNELSHFNLGYEASIKEDVWDTFQRGNALLDRHQALILAGNKNAKFVLLQGNHDYRAVDYSLKFPFLKGILDFEKNLRLRERGIKFVRCWENKEDLFHLGNAYFLHGNYTPMNHAKKMVENYGVSIFYGHTHDIMEFPKTLRGKEKTIVGKSLGCLCEYNQKYLKGNPTNWQQAFSEFWIWPDDYFQEETTKIFKGRFIKNGKVYD